MLRQKDRHTDKHTEIYGQMNRQNVFLTYRRTDPWMTDRRTDIWMLEKRQKG